MELRDYQLEIAEQAYGLLKEHGLCYLSMECRTGKTITALYIASMLKAKRVLFITKLKAISSIKADYKALNPDYELVVINYESAHKAEGHFDLVIIDEAHSLGAYPKPSKRTKAIKEISKDKRVMFLSGTPSPESYSQLYHQFWVSSFSPWRSCKTFYKWAKAGYIYPNQKRINGFLINDYSRANKAKIDQDTKELFISYSQEQAGFDVEINETTLIVPMKPETRGYIEELRSNQVLNIGENIILSDSPAKLLTKLHQLSSGTVIAENGAYLALDDSKAKFVQEKFRNKKIALFYVYQSEADLLRSVFPNWTDNPEEFQASTDKVFISQVRRAREGVRLDTAEALIFFNLEFSYLSYEQGRNRLASKERTEPAEVYFLCSDCGIESKILEAVHGKQNFTLSYYGRA